MEAIEKLRAMENWAGWQNESYNLGFKSISDIEKAYDFVNKTNDCEFVDQLNDKQMAKLESIIGYKLLGRN